MKKATGTENRWEEQLTKTATRTADQNKKAADKSCEKMADKNSKKIADRSHEKTADK